MASLASSRVAAGVHIERGSFFSGCNKTSALQMRGVWNAGFVGMPFSLQPANREVALLLAAVQKPLKGRGMRIEAQAFCAQAGRPLTPQQPGQRTDGVVSRKRCRCQAAKAASSKSGSASKTGPASKLKSEPVTEDKGRPIRRAKVSTNKPKEPAVAHSKKVAKPRAKGAAAVTANKDVDGATAVTLNKDVQEATAVSANKDGAGVSEGTEAEPIKISPFRSSWNAKDSTGRTYLENLGKESENVNVVVGARAGMVDHLFVGDVLGKESDIVFKYRQRVTRQFGHIHGDYYIAPAFMDKVVTHIAKNFLADQIDARVPLILGVWGGKGQGKSFQTELIFKALGLEPVIMSAGEMEGEWAGEPARLIRDRYRSAGQVVKVQGKMSALVINDIDAGAGRFDNTQMTVNTQMVMGTLMNLADNPTRVSTGQEYREADVVPRVPIILTGNDLTTLWAPLIRDGRMDKFYWTPTREDMINIVTCMYKNDGLEMSDIEKLVDTFPDQALDFYGAMRSRTYDNQVKKWLDSVGGPEAIRNIFPVKPGVEHPELEHYQQTLENLIIAGRELVEEQRMVNEMKLSDEYMNSTPQMVGGGISTSAS